MRPAPRAVTFDFGQVLASFDPAFLAQKLAAWGRPGADPARLDAALPEGWRAYGAALAAGAGGEAAWKALLATTLTLGGAPEAADPATLDALFRDQRERNLWRRPLPGMIDLVGELKRRGVPVGVVSNSEGALERLIAELGWAGAFACVADSGALGLEKPHAPIFHWAAERLGVAASELVHVGDSWEADVRGALGVGARALWFLADHEAEAPPRPLPEGVSFARDAAGARGALAALGLLDQPGPGGAGP
ncbi:MAG TPA: HAD family hydrolase [Polyangiaceae bacterium]|nr:HAD family hydrolase [Polyangiaceae bacterium]